MKSLSKLLALGLVVGTTATANAASTPNLQNYDLGETVITATRTPVKAFKANADVTVITAKDIADNHFKDLSQALRTVPGVYIGDFAPAGYDNSNSLKINGADEIVVMIDGVKVTNPQLKFSASNFKNLSNVERIEVLRGSASTLYGAGAKGGVINIITKTPRKNSTTITGEIGSFDYSQKGITSMAKEGSWSWDMGLIQTKSGDYKDGSGRLNTSKLNANNINLKISKELSAKNSVDMMYHSYHGTYKYRAWWEDVKDGDTSRNDYTIRLNTHFDDKSSNKLSYTQLNRHSDFNNYKTKLKTSRLSDSYVNYLSDKHTINAGFDFAKFSLQSSPVSSMTDKSIYLQDQYQMNEQVKLTTGLRYTHNSGFGNNYSPSINLGYTFSPETNVYASYSKYFITPSLTQLYDPQYGDSSLKPETGNTKEIGINHRLSKTTVASAHYFFRNSKNRLGYLSSTNHYANVGDEKAHGWNALLKSALNEHWSTSVGYTHTHIDPTAHRATNVDGYIPRDTWDLGLNYHKDRFDASLLGHGVIHRPGPQTEDAAANYFPATTYWVWDMSLNYQTSKSTKAYLKINNLFNKFYAENSNARTNWYGKPGQWWGSPGRSVNFGMEYQF